MLLHTDTLSQSKAVFLSAKNLIDNVPYILNPEKDNTFIIQGLGRGAQETVYLTNDTINYSGYKLTKYNDFQNKRSFASSNASNFSNASTLKSAEAVIDDLKKIIEKEKSF